MGMRVPQMVFQLDFFAAIGKLEFNPELEIFGQDSIAATPKSGICLASTLDSFTADFELEEPFVHCSSIGLVILKKIPEA